MLLLPLYLYHFGHAAPKDNGYAERFVGVFKLAEQDK